MGCNDSNSETNCETSLSIGFELDDGVENETSIDIDHDIFLLALILQILRSCCE